MNRDEYIVTAEMPRGGLIKGPPFVKVYAAPGPNGWCWLRERMSAQVFQNKGEAARIKKLLHEQRDRFTGPPQNLQVEVRP